MENKEPRNCKIGCRLTEQENDILIYGQQKYNFKTPSDYLRYLIKLDTSLNNQSLTPQQIEALCVLATEINRLREYNEELYFLLKLNNPSLEPYNYSIIERSLKNLWL